VVNAGAMRLSLIDGHDMGSTMTDAGKPIRL